MGTSAGGVTGAVVQPVQVKLHRAQIAGISHSFWASTLAQIGAGSSSTKVGSALMSVHGVGEAVGVDEMASISHTNGRGIRSHGTSFQPCSPSARSTQSPSSAGSFSFQL